MPGPYSNDLRECVISARADGRSCREVARLFNVSVSSVAGWSRRHKRTGSVRPDRMGRIHGSVPDGCRNWILERVRACRSKRRRVRLPDGGTEDLHGFMAAQPVLDKATVAVGACGGPRARTGRRLKLELRARM